MVEEVFSHKIVVALGLLIREPYILIQVEGGDLRKIQTFLPVPSNQLLVDTQGGGAGGTAQNHVWLRIEGLHHHLSRSLADLLVRFLNYDSHTGVLSIAEIGSCRNYRGHSKRPSTIFSISRSTEQLRERGIAGYEPFTFASCFLYTESKRSPCAIFCRPVPAQACFFRG